MNSPDPTKEPRSSNEAKKSESALTPLTSPVFRMLWIANTASNIGTWMQDVGGTWFMTSLTTSPIWIALMQAATSLPLFLLAVPAGVASDLFDRKRLMLLTTTWITAYALLLGFLILFGLHSAPLLLALTFILNLGTALFVPAWQASLPEMVPQEHLSGAVALNSASFNVARAVGPALGGLVLATLGTWAVYFVNALSCVILVVLLLRWKRPRSESKLPPEQFLAAMKIGIRYVRHSPQVRAILVRTAGFVVPASALFALLPVLVKQHLKLGASAFGTLVGCLGVGALCGVALLPKMRKRYSADHLALATALLLSVSLLGLTIAKDLFALAPFMLVSGFAWLITLSSFQVSTMAAVPAWVRGRALSIYLLIFYGGLASGAALWGVLANRFGLMPALFIASGSLVAGGLLALRFKLPQVAQMDLLPAGRWTEPLLVREIDPHDQAVMITVEYRVEAAKKAEFKKAMEEFREIRQRDGAFSWILTEDTADEKRYVEVFFFESWTEHMHQHQRTTVSDQTVEDRAKGFHLGLEPPKVSHLVVTRFPKDR